MSIYLQGELAAQCPDCGAMMYASMDDAEEQNNKPNVYRVKILEKCRRDHKFKWTIKVTRVKGKLK